MTAAARAAGDVNRQTRLAPEKLRRLIVQVLSQDPRPAYERGSSGARVFGMALWRFNVRWQVAGRTVTVLSVTLQEPA